MIHPQGEVTHLLGHLESCLQYFYSPQNKFPLKWLRLSFDHHFSRTFHLLRFYHGFCHYFFLHHLYIISFVPALTPSRFPHHLPHTRCTPSRAHCRPPTHRLFHNLHHQPEGMRVTTDAATPARHNHPESIVPSRCCSVETCTVTCIHHHRITQSIFSALTLLCAPPTPLSPSHPTPGATTDLLRPHGLDFSRTSYST